VRKGGGKASAEGTSRSKNMSSGRLPGGCRSSNSDGRLQHAQVNGEVEEYGMEQERMRNE
jgi:hypothetical protein